MASVGASAPKAAPRSAPKSTPKSAPKSASSSSAKSGSDNKSPTPKGEQAMTANAAKQNCTVNNDIALGNARGAESAAAAGAGNTNTVAAANEAKAAERVATENKVTAESKAYAQGKALQSEALTKARIEGWKAPPSGADIRAGDGVLKNGMGGAEVAKLQDNLNKATGKNLTVDGKFGANTEAAIREYQKASGLSVDGKVGKNTMASLDKAVADKQADADKAAAARGNQPANDGRDLTFGAPAADGAAADNGATSNPDANASPANPDSNAGATEAAKERAAHEAYNPPAGYDKAPMASDVAAGAAKLTKGMAGPAVEQLQSQLKAAGATVDVDGKFGPKTQEALRSYQASRGLGIDGVAGKNTVGALASGAKPVSTTDASGNPMEGRAVFNQTVAAGTRGQGKIGKITINGNTYDFVSGRGRDGGGGGRGHLPAGEYNVTRHRDSRLDKSTMRVGRTGYSFALNNKFDSRVGDTRTLLRIHPDGGREGTIGCIGIIGNEATQKQFRQDMLSAIRNNGGSYKLVVG